MCRLYKLQGQLSDDSSLLWLVVRCRTSDRFFKPWKNPEYRGRIWYPAYDKFAPDGWLNDETRLVYTAFTEHAGSGSGW